MPQINQFATQKTTIPNGSWIGFDWWNGTDWDTVKILSEDFGTALATRNYLNANLLATGNRSHDHDEYDMLWGKMKTFTAQSTIAPTGANASFNWKAYGSLVSDIGIREETGAGVAREVYGDRSQKNFGDVTMDSYKKVIFNGSLAYIRQSTGSNGLEVYGNGASHYFGWNNGQYLATGNLDIDSISHANSNANSYFAQTNGNYAWKFGKTGNNGAIRGNITGSYTNTEIITIDQVDGKTIFNLAGINMPNLPTSPTGLAVGDLWYFGGAVGIV